MSNDLYQGLGIGFIGHAFEIYESLDGGGYVVVTKQHEVGENYVKHLNTGKIVDTRNINLAPVESKAYDITNKI